MTKKYDMENQPDDQLEIWSKQFLPGHHLHDESAKELSRRRSLVRSESRRSQQRAELWTRIGAIIGLGALALSAVIYWVNKN